MGKALPAWPQTCLDISVSQLGPQLHCPEASSAATTDPCCCRCGDHPADAAVAAAAVECHLNRGGSEVPIILTTSLWQHQQQVQLFMVHLLRRGIAAALASGCKHGANTATRTGGDDNFAPAIGSSPLYAFCF